MTLSHRWPVRSRVLVNMVDGRAFDAVLMRVSGPLLTLADARLLEPGAEPATVDGRVIVERGRVAFIQVRD